MSNQKRIQLLRLKRARILALQERAHLRIKHGPRLVGSISEVIGKPISLDDFDVAWEMPFPLDWPRDISAAPGLVAAYVSRSKASHLLECFRDSLGTIKGRIGFHDKEYLGFARLEDINPAMLLHVSELTEDSVLFYVDNSHGVIFVDFYQSQPGEPFSIVVQGDDLVQRLGQCFEKCSPRL